jgi:uncharacterized protein YndB with AHSA1/START domain
VRLGEYDFGWEGGGPIKILELEPNHKLTYSWHYEDTVVTWILEDSEGGTRLTVVHSGFAKDRSTDDYTAGWLKFINSLTKVDGRDRRLLADGSGRELGLPLAVKLQTGQ